MRSKTEWSTCNCCASMANATPSAGGAIVSNEQSCSSGGRSDEGECTGKRVAPGAFRLRPLCEREAPNEWSFLAKPLLLVSAGPDSLMDGARLCGTKSRASGNGEPSGGLRVVKRPNALVRRCIRISGFDAMAAMLFTGTMARHPGGRRRRGGGVGTNSRSDAHRKAAWQP